MPNSINSVSLPYRQGDSGSSYYSPGPWREWATSTHHLLRSVFGIGSLHDTNFGQIYANTRSGLDIDIEAMRGIFRAAKANYESGFAVSLQARISGEIFGDFVALARRTLDEGSKDVAAVLACAALEDALKRVAAQNGLEVSDKGMKDVVNALKGKGLVTGAQKTLLDTMPKIRDYAMHAEWDKITPQDVGSVIGFVEQLLLRQFS